MTNSGLQMDYDVELSSDLFRVKGNLLFAGNKQLPYVFINATLGQGERAIINTRYLMMQIEPERECGFEICKSCSLSAGEYDCALSVEASEGILAEDVRKVSLAQGQSGIGGWSKTEEAVFWKMIEENEREADEGRGDFIEEETSGEDASESEEDEGREDENREDAGEAKAGAKVESDAMAEDERPRSAFDEEDLLVGSITSKKYHRPDCRYAQKIKPENLISFSSIDDAMKQGYIPCKVCNP
ncbi:MAG: Ada metal-binding domain-containing protein [Methanothrix sp.]